MDNILNRREIAEGVFFSSVTDGRYKKNYISVCFYSELSEENATANVAVPCVLSKSNSTFPTYKQLKNKLSTLYGSSLHSAFGRKYDLQYTGLAACFIDDAFAIQGEKITAEVTDILIDCLFSPVTENGVFPEKTVALEKQTVIDNIEAIINDKRSYAVNKTISLLCEGEPMAIFPFGTVQRANELTAESVYEAYKKIITSMHCEIMCVGCSDFRETEEKLAAAFGKIERKNIVKYSMNRSPAKSEVREETEKLQVNQSKMVLGFKTDCEDLGALVMMQKIYGGSTSSKLFMNVREKMSLCYYCSASFNEVKGIMIVDCGVENENIVKAREEILRQLDEIKNGNFTDEDIMFARMSVKNDYNSIYDSVQGVAGWYSDHILKNRIETPAQSIERFMDVTKERICAAAASMKLDTVYVLTSSDN